MQEEIHMVYTGLGLECPTSSGRRDLYYPAPGVLVVGVTRAL